MHEQQRDTPVTVDELQDLIRVMRIQKKSGCWSSPNYRLEIDFETGTINIEKVTEKGAWELDLDLIREFSF